jgi:hypothetical protein
MDALTFIEKYNTIIKWNNDLIDSLDRDFINGNEFIEDIVLDELDCDPITEEEYDFSSGSVYTLDSTCKELQIRTHTGGCNYFLLNVRDNDEVLYKKRKIVDLTESIKNEEIRLNSLIQTSQEQLHNMEILTENINMCKIFDNSSKI